MKFYLFLIILPFFASSDVIPNVKLTLNNITKEDFALTFNYDLEIIDKSDEFLMKLNELVSITVTNVMLKYSSKPINFIRILSKKYPSKEWKIELRRIHRQKIEDLRTQNCKDVKLENVIDEIFECQFQDTEVEYHGILCTINESKDDVQLDQNNFNVLKISDGIFIIKKRSQLDFDDFQNFDEFKTLCVISSNFWHIYAFAVVFISFFTAIITIILEIYNKI